ncbi:DNA ligase [Fasciolopsis buskii]|uniref:DNA ligase n=1 Tax=Fasciolopsis buskii TaxID=27845 RepID=A0A8E0VK23_9TREM|nr:DNA ligase [Fasciolopsis buski]
MFTPKPLTISVVFAKLKEISAMSGNASQAKKIERISSLLVACRECEAKYLIRSLSGKLRIGLAEQTVLTALGQAACYTPFHSAAAVKGCNSSGLLDASVGQGAEQWKARVETAVANVKKAYCVCPNYDKLVAGLLADGPDGLHLHCFITPGVPVKPMLAHPTRGVTDVLKRFDECDFTCEYKYDGERAQIHVLSTGVIHVYSRNQEDNTAKYPDIVNNLMPRVISSSKLGLQYQKLLDGDADVPESVDSNTVSCVPVESCILDSEVVAWDRQANQILPFQVLSTRKRKDVEEATVRVQVCVFPFDLLYLNGVSLIEKPLRIRRQILRNTFSQLTGEFMFATSLDSSDTDEIAAFLDESIKGL